MLQQCSSPQNSLFTVNIHITLRLPSLPLHLDSQSRSPRESQQPRPRSSACASFYSCSISLCYFWGPPGLSNPENQKGEREGACQPKKRFLPSFPTSPSTPHHPLTSDCALSLCGSRLQDLAGRPAAAPERDKDWIFPAMEAWPDPFRSGRWSGFLTRSDSYWFK